MDKGTELLLGCLREDNVDIKSARLQEYTATEWGAVLAASAKLRLMPLLFHTLRPHFGRLPSASGVREELKQAYMVSGARNMRLYRQLFDLLALFNANGIPVILLKGVHLAEVVYGNVALRPMADIDLLIRPEDLAEADRFMKNKGYDSSDLLQGNSLEHLAPYNKKNAFQVEIHFQITEPPFSRRFAVEELWSRSRRESIEGIEVLTLCPEDLMLHICAHGGIHHGFRFGLFPYIDYFYCARHYEGELDRDILWQRAESWGMQKALYLFASLSEKLFGNVAPALKIENMTSDREANEALAVAESLIFDKSQGAPPFIARLFSRSSLSDKFALLYKRVFIPDQCNLSPRGENSAGRVAIASRLKTISLRLKGLSARHRKRIWLILRRDPVTIQALQTEGKKRALRDWIERTPGC